MINKKCYCDEVVYRKCVYCQEIEDRKEDIDACSRWNWNYTPNECAMDAIDRGWSIGRLKNAMKAFGYTPSQIMDVVHEFEKCR